MASALLAYGGIAVKMLLDERHGAYLGNMFMVDYQPDVVLHPHDHPVEEVSNYLDSDAVFAVKPSLIKRFEPRDPDDPDRPPGVSGPWFSLHTDLVLAPVGAGTSWDLDC